MPTDKELDLIVIGAGPGGYVATIRAAQLGMKVACIEKTAQPGGTCLNVGCIPSKCLLDSSEHYERAKNRLGRHGILVNELRLDLQTMMARKDQVVNDLCGNVRQLLEGCGASIVHGSARLQSPTQVQVTSVEKGSTAARTLSAGTILLATGSEPVEIPTIPFDGKHIVGSTEALSFDSVPEHLGIVGGGYIGLELGSVWRRLGARVTVIEMMPSIATLLDGQIARTLQRLLVQQGFKFRVGTKVVSADVHGGKVTLKLVSEGREETLQCDRLLVAVGRRPYARGLGLDEVGVGRHPKTGHVLVNEQYRTSIPSVYAVGDLIEGPMLAHKASAEAVAAVECMAGLPGEVNYDAIPAIIYTSPEVASVGLTEEQARERGVRYCVGSYPFSGAGRARCMGETDGFVKIIIHPRTDRILGVHIIGPRASDMIAECVLAMELHATTRDVGRTVHGHPTFSEAIHEAAMASRKCSIYAP